MVSKTELGKRGGKVVYRLVEHVAKIELYKRFRKKINRLVEVRQAFKLQNLQL